MTTAALSNGVLAAAGLAALVAVVVALAIAIPMIFGSGEEAAPEGSDQLRIREDLDRSLAAVAEIAEDRAAGNLSDADFADLDAAERARAVQLMRRLDDTEP